MQGESKHGDYKKDVRSTNNKHSAATLIRREEEDVFIMFCFAGASHGDENLENIIEVLRKQCPTLTGSFDRYFGVDGGLEGAELDQEEEESLAVAADQRHQKPVIQY